MELMYLEQPQLISYSDRMVLCILGAASVKNSYIMSLMSEQYVLDNGNIELIDDYDALD